AGEPAEPVHGLALGVRVADQPGQLDGLLVPGGRLRTAPLRAVDGRDPDQAAERAAPVADGPAGAQRPFEAPQRGPAPLAGEVGVAEAVQGQPLAVAVAAGARFGEAPLEPPVRGLPAAQAVPGVEVAHVELRAGVAHLADDGARGR